MPSHATFDDGVATGGRPRVSQGAAGGMGLSHRSRSPVKNGSGPPTGAGRAPSGTPGKARNEPSGVFGGNARPVTAPDHAARRPPGSAGTGSVRGVQGHGHHHAPRHSGAGPAFAGPGNLYESARRYGRPYTAGELSERSYGGGGGQPNLGRGAGASGKLPTEFNRHSQGSLPRPGTSGSRASLVSRGGGRGPTAGATGSWASFVEAIPDRASDAVWKHKDISYRHDRVGHGMGSRMLKSGRQSMYLDTVLPPSLLDGNSNADYREGSKMALERLIRTVVDETGSGVMGAAVRHDARPKTSPSAYVGSPARSFRPGTRGGQGEGGGSRVGGSAPAFGTGSETGRGAGARVHAVEVSYASWVQAVGEGAESRLPAGRSEVELLRAWLKAQLEKTAAAHDDDELDPGDMAAEIQQVYDRGACELARQVTVHCAERGSFLSELWEGHTRVLGAVMQRLAQERKVLAENAMELVTRMEGLEHEKTSLLATNVELERSNENLREALKAALKERDQATVERNEVVEKFNDHVSNVELWLPDFTDYRETGPFLHQLRANRGVGLAATLAKDPEKGVKLYNGGESLVHNIQRLVKMFISLARGTPQDWNWEGQLVRALSTAGVEFGEGKERAAIEILRDSLLDLENRLRKALSELEEERYKRMMQDTKLRELEEDLAKKRKELIWRRAFNYCEWHPKKVEVVQHPTALVTQGDQKPKGRQIIPTSCIPAPFQLLLTTPDAKAFIKHHRFPADMQFMKRGAVIQLIKDITETKLILEREEDNRELLPEFIYGFMLRKYGLVKMAEKYMVEFMASCLKYKLDSPRIMMFCRFLSLKGSDPLSAAAFEFVLHLYRVVAYTPATLADKFLEREAKKALLNTPMQMQLAREGGLEVYVSAERANKVMNVLFKGRDKILQDTLSSVEAQAELEGKGHSFNFMKISMECLEGIAVQGWEAQGGDSPVEFEEMFKRADTNGDGVLSYEEFAKLMSEIKPDLGLTTTLAIFREAIAESSSFEGDVITPDAFARVMSSHNIKAPKPQDIASPAMSTQASQDGGGENHASMGFEREAFKIDYILLPKGFMDQYYLTLTKVFQAYGKAVSKIMEDFDVEGRMDMKNWFSFLSDAGIVGGGCKLSKGRAQAIFQDANGDRFETSEAGTREVVKDHDADSLVYSEFKYALAMVAHSMYPSKSQLAYKIDALVEEHVKTV